MKELPIIYVRGYAGRQGDVEETVDDPFYGFNKGSTHVRVGPKGDAQFFGFESPLVRLITDFRYVDAYRGGIQEIPSGLDAGQRLRTIWIYRYYDPTSTTFPGNQGRRLSIEEAATGLKAFIDKVKGATGASQVLLVAHSMGGLVCRSLIQKVYPEAGANAQDHIDKLFTFGTPHGGIHFAVGAGLLEWIRDQLGCNNADDFGILRMYQYLTKDSNRKLKRAPADFSPYNLQGCFPPERVFCLVGTNAHDYDVALGMSRRTVGPQSDGLVQTQHAYAHGASRAYVHRSHSGRYGMVNSEEGFQNLQRFLFGEVRVEMSLRNLALPGKAGTTYYAEVGVSMRGLPILMHDQNSRHLCPVDLGNGQVSSVPLYTSFLMPGLSATSDNRARFVIYLGIHDVQERGGLFAFTHHLEEVPLWADYLIVEVEAMPDPAAKPKYGARYAWLSSERVPVTTLPLAESPANSDAVAGTVSLPPKGRELAGKGACIHFETSHWE